MWDARDGRNVTSLKGTAVENLYFAPDGRHMVAEQKDRQIRVWSLRDFVLTLEISASDNQMVTGVSPGGSWLLTCRRDEAGPIRLYHLASGCCFEPYDCRSAGRNLSDG